MKQPKKFAMVVPHVLYTQKGKEPISLKGMVGIIEATSSGGKVTTMEFDGLRIKLPTEIIEPVAKKKP